MDKIEKYKNIIEEELAYQATKTLYGAPNVHRHLIVSRDRTDFLLLSIGWEGKAYRHNIIFHIQIKENKVWLMKNNTNILIDRLLMEQGIKPLDIEIGSISAYLRAVRKQSFMVKGE